MFKVIKGLLFQLPRCVEDSNQVTIMSSKLFGRNPREKDGDMEKLSDLEREHSLGSSNQWGMEEPEVMVASSAPVKMSFVNRVAANLNAETKGIEPVGDDEKHDDSLINAASMWFSANMVLAAFSVGALGPMVFGLNFGASVLTVFFFNILGLLPVAFFSLFGVEFGLRQMVLSRYLLGNLAARWFSLINVVACVGWGAVNTVVSAQLLNTLETNGRTCPLWAGCLVLVGGTVMVTFFGYNFIHSFQKYSWIPNFAVFLVIIARLKMSHQFINGSWGGGATTAGGVLSYGSAIFGFASGWTTYASDYTAYMPRNTSKPKVFFSLIAGLSFPLFFTMILGAACGASAAHNPVWTDYYNQNQGGGLVFAILVPDSLHGFGKFCCVVLAVCTIANTVPNMYTLALSAQATWEPFANIPRVAWTLMGNGAVLAIAIPACYFFSEFMENFVNSISYYLAIYISLALTEHFIFRRGDFSTYIVEHYNQWDKLPVGIAGLVAFFVAAFGVALGMSQTYWTGEIARRIGKEGGDIGFELGGSWAFVTYLALRPLERKYFKR